jgi:hypothetical protein
MTPDERRAQRISFAYGNLAMSNSAATKALVTREADAMAPKGTVVTNFMESYRQTPLTLALEDKTVPRRMSLIDARRTARRYGEELWLVMSDATHHVDRNGAYGLDGYHGWSGPICETCEEPCLEEDAERWWCGPCTGLRVASDSTTVGP